MENSIIAFKGMDKDMKCRGFQFAQGGEYETEGEIRACHNGFHACERPIDVFNYYPPATSRYFAVKQSGDLSRDGDNSKVVSRKIKIGAEIGIPGLVKAQIEYVKAHTTTVHTDPERATVGDYGAATAWAYGAATAGGYGAATAGDYGAATAGEGGAATAGEGGAATAGDCGTATAGSDGAATAGGYGAATAGNYGTATAGSHGAATAGEGGAATAGDYGAATAGKGGAATAGEGGAATAGDYGTATAGNHGAATAGNHGAATAGEGGAATAGNCGVATSRDSVTVGKNGCGTVRGNNVKIRGGIGAMLTICVEKENSYDVVGWKSFVVDGENYKPDTWYTLKDGKIIEVDET